MARTLWILCLLLLVNSLDAQKLLSSKFSEQGLQQVLIPREEWMPVPAIEDRDTWDNIPQSVRDYYINEAEKLMDYAWPPIPATTTLMFVRDGNRSIHDGLCGERRTTLGILLMAEILENEGRFLDPIIDGIWSFCEQSSWCYSAHLKHSAAGSGLPDVAEPWVDLFAAEMVNFLAWADYFLGDKLDEVSPQIRKRIHLEANRRIFTPLLTTPHMWMEFTMNWNPWICSNWLSSILLLESDPAVRAKHVSMALASLDNFLDPYPADGGCDEGPGYWNAAGSSLFECLEILNLATGGQFQVFNEEKIRNIGSYIYKVQLGENYFLNFADAHPVMHPDGRWISHFGERINDPLMMQFGAFYTKPGQLRAESSHFNRQVLLLAKEASESAPAAGLPLPSDVWFPQIEVMLARDKSGSMEGFCLAAKGGHNSESHNHNDVGNFVVYYDGLPLLIDVGSGTYTARFFSSERYSMWMTNSAHHNLPLINGMEQPAGARFKASEVKYSKKGKNAGLSMELKNAYPDDAGIRTWIRTLTHTEGKGIFLKDSYELEKPGSFSEYLMTTYLPDLSTPGLIKLTMKAMDDQPFLIKYDRSLLEASYEVMSQSEPEDAAVLRSWGPVYRIELKTTQPVQKGETEITITTK